MNPFLLDVNVLIALIDPGHVKHDLAHEWFALTGKAAWATCPITENGVIRIAGNSRYINSVGNPGEVADMLQRMRGLPGHRFWPDDITLLDERYFYRDRLLASAHLTDSYLLALASAHNGKLATLDRRLVTNAVVGGHKALHVILQGLQ